MHAKPDLRVGFAHNDHSFRLGDLGRYLAKSMSNYIHLYCIESEELVDGHLDRPITESCCPALEAINWVPMLWLMMFRESNLDTRPVLDEELESNDPGHSVLHCKKSVGLRQLKESVLKLAEISKTDLREHEKYFRKYLNSFSGKHIAIAGLAEWITDEKYIREILTYLGKPTKKRFHDFISFFDSFEHLSPPPTRKEYRSETCSNERHRAYSWLFGAEPEDYAHGDFPIELPTVPWI